MGDPTVPVLAPAARARHLQTSHSASRASLGTGRNQDLHVNGRRIHWPHIALTGAGPTLPLPIHHWAITGITGHLVTKDSRLKINGTESLIHFSEYILDLSLSPCRLAQECLCGREAFPQLTPARGGGRLSTLGV